LLPSINDISSLRGWILIQDRIIKTLFVEDYMIEKTPQNFLNFIVKIGSKAEIC
jgi:hypothetical protein